MPDTIVYILLFLALVLPVPGALLLRLLYARLGERGMAIAVAALFGVAVASTLVLARSDVGMLRAGELTLLLPGTRASDDGAMPPDLAGNDTPPAALPAPPPTIPTLTPRPSATPAPSPTPTVTATAEPSPTPTVTATAEPSPTPVPPTAAPAAGEPRRYTVQPGDTLRGIAEQFGVAVDAILEANDLTAAQGDALRVGQELVIP